MKRLAMLVLVACHGRAAAPLPPLEVATLEARRDLADGKLLAAAKDGPLESRVRALHALGRVGGAGGVAALRDATKDKDEGIRVAAVEGLWFAEAPAADVAPLYGTAGAPLDRAVVRALGRLATEKEMPLLARALAAAAPDVRGLAGIAAGVAGRRKVPYSDDVRAALVRNIAGDPESRAGAAYGLAYDPKPAPEAALASLDGSPWIRALAVHAEDARHVDVPKALEDADVWVRCEAERGLATTPAGRATLAPWLVREWTSLGDTQERLTSERLHPILDGMVRLAPFAGEPEVAKAFAALFDLTDVSRSTERDRYTPGMLLSIDTVNCRAAVGLVHGGAPLAKLAGCGEASGRGWPVWARRQLVAGAIKDGVGTPNEQRAALAELWKDPDVRVRAGAVEAAVKLLPDTEAMVRDGLGATDVAVAESAADALGGLGEKAPEWVGPALAARAATAATEPELYQSVLDAIVAVKAPAADAVLTRAAADPNPAVRAKARALLGAKAPPEAPAAAPLPPNDAAAVLGAHPTFTVTTTKGVFHVELDPDVAPWNVATLVALAEKHFFDGTIWHRVVAGFVVQGGDPTGTGAGGPGYSVVAEPSAVGYARGVVGIADAGKDTGGSQWFIALAPAPHLDGRYTVVGRVPDADMAVVDRIQVGDQIVKIEVAGK